MILTDLKLGESAIIKKLNNNNYIKRRLMDIGITKNNIIKCELENIDKSFKAYTINNSLIAIRKEDANNIIVEVLYD